MRSAVAAGARAPAILFAVFLLIGSCESPASAADLDLEQRLSELEATVAHGGNRRLSLHMYGQVNRAMLFWDDSFAKGTFGVDNHTSSSRFGFIGRTQVGPSWVAGYRIEVEAAFPSSAKVFNGPDGGEGWNFASANSLLIRQAYWDVTNKNLGRVSIGFQSPATDDITIINLGSQMNDAAVHFNNAFRVRLALGSPIVTDLRWGQIAHNVDSLRGNFMRYDTPILAGFLVSTAFNDDVWDVALRYQKEWAAFRFAGGIGYMKDDAVDFEDIKGSASLMHGPTGLFVSVAGGLRNAKQAVQSANEQAYFYYAQLGISRPWLTAGNTTLYVDHGIYSNFSTGAILSVDPDGNPMAWGTLVDTKVRRWGFGIEQAVDAAGLLLYAQAHFYDPRIVGYPCDAVDDGVCGGDPAQITKLPAQPWQGYVLGARIKF